MRSADFTGTSHRRKVTDSYNCATGTIRPLENAIEEIHLAVLQIPSQGVAAQISNLDEASETAINEQRRLY
jgi:hypothetical protein